MTIFSVTILQAMFLSTHLDIRLSYILPDTSNIGTIVCISFEKLVLWLYFPSVSISMYMSVYVRIIATTKMRWSEKLSFQHSHHLPFIGLIIHFEIQGAVINIFLFLGHVCVWVTDYNEPHDVIFIDFPSKQHIILNQWFLNWRHILCFLKQLFTIFMKCARVYYEDLPHKNKCCDFYFILCLI